MQIHLLDLKNIVACESDSCYTTVHTKDGEHISAFLPIRHVKK